MLTALTRAAVLTLALAWLTAAATAGEAVNADPDGLAIKGYDPVAYFTLGAPTPGDPELEHVWQNARWRFVTAEHLDRFRSDPVRYAPRYGGFCAGAMSKGFKAPVDPTAFAIVDGKLYLAYSDSVIDTFEADADSHVAQADGNWAQLGTTD